ncbi:predicted protein [Postia placenta Mad-698-R]|nr:predicted protein [Postia placenta Mad-698-R]
MFLLGVKRIIMMSVPVGRTSLPQTPSSVGSGLASVPNSPIKRSTNPAAYPVPCMMFGPLKKRENGTIVFATPVGNGHVPMIALSDMGFFARYTFDNRATASGQDLAIATEMVGWEHLKTTFEKVTGQKAEVVSQTIDDWLEDRYAADRPVAHEGKIGLDTTTWRLNFRGWWALWRDDIVKRDMEWIRKVNAKGHTLESWMREQNYGDHLWQKIDILKITEDGHMGILPGKERLQKL